MGTARVQGSGGTKTRHSLESWSEFRYSRRQRCDSGGHTVRNRIASLAMSSLALFTSSLERLGRNGNIASLRRPTCDTRLRSAPSRRQAGPECLAKQIKLGEIDDLVSIPHSKVEA